MRWIMGKILSQQSRWACSSREMIRSVPPMFAACFDAKTVAVSFLAGAVMLEHLGLGLAQCFSSSTLGGCKKVWFYKRIVDVGHWETTSAAEGIRSLGLHHRNEEALLQIGRSFKLGFTPPNAPSMLSDIGAFSSKDWALAMFNTTPDNVGRLTPQIQLGAVRVEHDQLSTVPNVAPACIATVGSSEFVCPAAEPPLLPDSLCSPPVAVEARMFAFASPISQREPRVDRHQSTSLQHAVLEQTTHQPALPAGVADGDRSCNVVGGGLGLACASSGIHAAKTSSTATTLVAKPILHSRHRRAFSSFGQARAAVSSPCASMASWGSSSELRSAVGFGAAPPPLIDSSHAMVSTPPPCHASAQLCLVSGLDDRVSKMAGVPVDGASLQSEAAPPVHVTSDLPAPVTKQHSLRMAFSTSAGKESGHFDGGPVFAGLQPVVKRKKGNA